MFNKYFTIPLIRNIYVRIVFLYLDFEPNDFNNYLYNTIFLLATIFIRNYIQTKKFVFAILDKLHESNTKMEF